LKDSNANPKMKNNGKEGVGVRSLAHSTSWVKWHARIMGWGLG